MNAIPEDAQLVGGVLLPKSEIHLVDMMSPGAKRHKVVDGKWVYQFHKLEAAVSHCKQRRVAIDIGGHVGLWSMHLVRMFESVHAFEPVPLHADLFGKNMPGDANNWTLHRHALGDESGRVDIEIPLETTGNAHVALGKPHPGTKHVPNPGNHYVVRDVPVCPLDSVGLTNVDFIKIDVEGFELPVVRGAEDTLLRDMPVVIVEQKRNDRAYGDHTENQALRWLHSIGMKTLDVKAGDYILGW